MVEGSEKQALIERRRREISLQYPKLWANVLAAWRRPPEGDRACLTYAANYLFHTAGTRWAIDPLVLSSRIPDARPVDVANDLRGLSFVLLTHRHADHLDIDVLRALRVHPITWVIPKDIASYVREQAGLDDRNIIIPRAGSEIGFNELTVLPFEGRHWEETGKDESGKPVVKGVPSVGYQVKCRSKTWLFPGDVRNYELKDKPDFGPVDVVFAHLWLGRHCALQESPPLLDAFCKFYIHFDPARIVVTHMEELGRKAQDYWDMEHYRQVQKRWKELAPHIDVQAALTGDQVFL